MMVREEMMTRPIGLKVLRGYSKEIKIIKSHYDTKTGQFYHIERD